jgi:cephalosporin-C deacetylase-like acetyl esterase
MDTKPADFDQYWQRTLGDLAWYSARPEIELLPLRTTDFATLYGVHLTSLGPYRLFGYLSVPTGKGPFPAIYYAPKYQSVLEIIPQGTANLQRSAYITFALADAASVPLTRPMRRCSPACSPRAAVCTFSFIALRSLDPFSYLYGSGMASLARMRRSIASISSASSPFSWS